MAASRTRSRVSGIRIRDRVVVWVFTSLPPASACFGSRVDIAYFTPYSHGVGFTAYSSRRSAMRAIVQDTYGSAEAIHVGDWILMTGSPWVMRLATGLRRPKNRVPGTDVAGTVEAVGSNVQELRPGDEVFGWGAGAFAEFARATEDHFIKKPANLTFEQASAVGVSATTALQLLRDDGKVRPGQKVLVNGASGGVGTFAVQIAKAFGAEVTGVC